MANDRNTVIEKKRQQQLNTTDKYSSFDGEKNTAVDNNLYREHKTESKMSALEDIQNSAFNALTKDNSVKANENISERSRIAEIHNKAMTADLNLQDAQKEYELKIQQSKSSNISEIPIYKTVPTGSLLQTIAKMEKHLIKDGIRTAALVTCSQSEGGISAQIQGEACAMVGGIAADITKNVLGTFYNMEGGNLENPAAVEMMVKQMANLKDARGNYAMDYVCGVKIGHGSDFSMDAIKETKFGGLQYSDGIRIHDQAWFAKECSNYVKKAGYVTGRDASSMALFKALNHKNLSDADKMILKYALKDRRSQFFKHKPTYRRITKFGFRQIKHYYKQSEAGSGLADTLTYAYMAKRTAKLSMMAISQMRRSSVWLAQKSAILTTKLAVTALKNTKAAKKLTEVHKTISNSPAGKQAKKAIKQVRERKKRNDKTRKAFENTFKKLNPFRTVKTAIANRLKKTAVGRVISVIMNAVANVVAAVSSALSTIIGIVLLLITVLILIGGVMSAILSAFDMGEIFADKKARELKALEQLTEQLQTCYESEMKSIYAVQNASDHYTYGGDNGKLFNHTEYKDQALYNSYGVGDIYPDDNSEELLAMTIVYHDFDIQAGWFGNSKKACKYIADLFYNSHRLETTYTVSQEDEKTVNLVVYVYYLPYLFDMKIIEGRSTILGAPSTAGGVTVTDGGEIADVVWQYLIDSGFTEIQAASVMGNIWGESDGNIAAIERPGFDPTCIGIGYGLCQWTNTQSAYGTSWRCKKLWEYAATKGESEPQLQTQLEYMLAEMGLLAISGVGSQWTSGYQASWQNACNDGDLDQATYLFMKGWERPDAKYERLDVRQGWAWSIYNSH